MIKRSNVDKINMPIRTACHSDFLELCEQLDVVPHFDVCVVDEPLSKLEVHLVLFREKKFESRNCDEA